MRTRLNCKSFYACLYQFNLFLSNLNNLAFSLHFTCLLLFLILNALTYHCHSNFKQDTAIFQFLSSAPIQIASDRSQHTTCSVNWNMLFQFTRHRKNLLNSTKVGAIFAFTRCHPLVYYKLSLQIASCERALKHMGVIKHHKNYCEYSVCYKTILFTILDLKPQWWCFSMTSCLGKRA